MAFVFLCAPIFFGSVIAGLTRDSGWLNWSFWLIFR